MAASIRAGELPLQPEALGTGQIASTSEKQEKIAANRVASDALLQQEPQAVYAGIHARATEGTGIIGGQRVEHAGDRFDIDGTAHLNPQPEPVAYQAIGA